MIKWIKSFVPRTAAKPTLRIVADPEHGYCAMHRDECGWWAIDGDGVSGPAIDDTYGISINDYWSTTEEEAGRRVNLFATCRGRKVVWEAA